MLKHTQFILTLVLQIRYAFLQDLPPPVATISEGQYLEGTNQYSVNGRVIDAFLGIPYAKAPLGSLRFSAPVSAKQWRGIKDAKQKSSPCLQNDLIERSGSPFGSEDCLYLNVFTPRNRDDHPLSVMVYFHGGAYYLGSSDPVLYGPERLLDHNIILVTVNYRLGALGFLSTLTQDSPGNYGLKDQSLALKWIHRYISAFGGNEEDVTIFGNTAGATSVSLHLVSPASTGLFHKAIIQSGNYFDIWAVVVENEAEKRAKRLAEFLSCPVPANRNYEAMIKCLRQKNAADIISAQERFFIFPTGDPFTVFAPVVEPESSKAFLDKHPWEISQSYGDHIPVIIGCTSGEGLIRSASIIYQYTNEFKEVFDELLPTIFYYDHLPAEQQSDITERVKDYYFRNGFEWSRKNNRNLTNMYSDGGIYSGMEKFLHRRRTTAGSSDTFAYMFDHNPPISTSLLYGGGSEYYGVSNGDELPFLFPFGQLGLVYKKRDRQMGWALSKMWTDFAKTGNPTPPTSWITPKWKRVKSFPYRYALIGSQYTRRNRSDKIHYIGSRFVNKTDKVAEHVGDNSNESARYLDTFRSNRNIEFNFNGTNSADEYIVRVDEIRLRRAASSAKLNLGKNLNRSLKEPGDDRYNTCWRYSRKKPCTILKNMNNRFWSGFYWY